MNINASMCFFVYNVRIQGWQLNHEQALCIHYTHKKMENFGIIHKQPCQTANNNKIVFQQLKY